MSDYRGRVSEIPGSREILFESRVAERESRIGKRLIDETRKEENDDICFRWIILRTYRITYRRRLWSYSRRPEGCLRPWECKDHSIHKLVSHCPYPYAYKPLHLLAFTRLRCIYACLQRETRFNPLSLRERFRFFLVL